MIINSKQLISAYLIIGLMFGFWTANVHVGSEGKARGLEEYVPLVIGWPALGALAGANAVFGFPLNKEK